MAKSYYWLKIQEDFYRQKEIKVLRQMEKGATYIIIYQKMLIYSLKNGNKLFYDNLKESFEEELALLIDEDVEDVKKVVEFLNRAHLMESVSEEEYVLTQVEQLTGSESESTKRVRKHRENKKGNSGSDDKKGSKGKDDAKDKKDEECKDKGDDISHGKQECKNDNGDTNCDDKMLHETFCNKNVTLAIEKELDLELELDTDIDKDLKQNKKAKNPVGGCVSENLAKISKLYEQNIGQIYPANAQYFVEISEKIHWSLFKKAIEICIDKNNMNPAYLKGIIKKWQSRNIYTLEDFEAKEMDKGGNKGKKQNLKNNSWENEKIDEDMLAEMNDLERKLGVS